MHYNQMRVKDLIMEAKKHGLIRYSSLNKAQLIQYLATGVHPIRPNPVLISDKSEEPTVLSENQTQFAPSKRILSYLRIPHLRNFLSIKLYTAIV